MSFILNPYTGCLDKVNAGTASKTIYVSKEGIDEEADGTAFKPFASIEAANNYAIENLPVWPNKVMIKVAPGIYTEHLTQAHYRVFIMGEIDPTEKDSLITIRNTGADEDHYIFGCYKNIHILGCNIVTTGDDNEPIEGIYGKLQRGSTFSYCHFRNGYFIEQNDSVGTIYQAMHNCYFTNGNAFRLEGSVDAYRSLNFINCTLDGATDMLLGSTCSDDCTNTIKLDNTYINGNVNVKGNWDLLMIDSEMWEAKLTLDTDGYVDIFGSTLYGGIHFYTDPPLTKKLVNCIFKGTPTGEGDITADESIEFIEYSGNHQHNGIDGEVITVSKIKNVGGGQNKYRNIHEALKGSILTDTIINLEGDVEVDSPLIINPNIDVQIDGNKKWKLTSTATSDLVELGANQHLSFVNMKQIKGGKKAIVNGSNATLSLVSCGRYTEPNYVNIEMTAGNIESFVYIVKGTLIGTNAPPITINNAATWLIIDRSFIKGPTGEPAIEWSVDADSKFKTKRSTFVHGSKGTNSPLEFTGSGDITLSMYSCAMNADFPASDFTNNIGNASNVVDPQIDF